MSSPEQTQMAIFAVEEILKNGVPAFLTAIRTLSDDPTIEEIRALRDALASPESYFVPPTARS